MGWRRRVQELCQRSGWCTKGETLCQWHTALWVPQEIYGKICEINYLVSFYFNFTDCFFLLIVWVPFLWLPLFIPRVVYSILVCSVFQMGRSCTDIICSVVYKWLKLHHLNKAFENWSEITAVCGKLSKINVAVEIKHFQIVATFSIVCSLRNDTAFHRVFVHRDYTCLSKSC